METTRDALTRLLLDPFLTADEAEREAAATPRPAAPAGHRMNLLRSSRFSTDPSRSRTNGPSTTTRLSGRSGPS